MTPKSFTVVDMVDTIHATVDRIPANFPKVAGYTTGTPDIQWTAEDWARFHGSKVRINQRDDSSPFDGDVFDIESGAWLIPRAVAAARVRKAKGLHSTFYIEGSQLAEADQAATAAGLAEWVYYGIANWNLSRDEAISLLGNRVVWVQWASPSSNPHTLLPGTNLTLAEANADLGVTVSWWHPAPHKHSHRHPHPHAPKRLTAFVGRAGHKVSTLHPKAAGALGGGGLGAAVVSILVGSKVHLTPTEAAGISTLTSLLVAWLVPSGGGNG